MFGANNQVVEKKASLHNKVYLFELEMKGAIYDEGIRSSSVKFHIKMMEKRVMTTIVVPRKKAQLERLSKKRRKEPVRFAYEDDEQICLTVLAWLTAQRQWEKLTLPLFGARWFQANVVNTGLLQGRTGQSLYQRFKAKLHIILSDVVDWANRNGVRLKDDLEIFVLERLRALHGLVDSEIEVIQVELSPTLQEF